MLREKLNLGAFLEAKTRAYLFLLPLSVIIGIAYMAYANRHRQPSFTSSGRLVISGRLNFSEGNPVASDFLSVLGTQLEILTSEELRERAMIRLRLERPQAATRPDLSARLLNRTTIFELTATSSTPDYVQRYLELLMEEYIAMRREQRLLSSRSVMDQISSEVLRLEKLLNEQEAELFRFKQQRNIVFWEQQASTAARFLSQLKNREASLRMQLKLADLLDQGSAKESLAERASTLTISSAEEPAPRRPASTTNTGSALAAQKMRLRELEIERETIARVYLPKHPRYQKIEGEIAKLRRLVALLEEEDGAIFRAEVDGMRSELNTILASMGEWENTVRESTHIEAEHQKLQSTVTRTRELYQRLVGSLQNIDFRKGVDDEVVQTLMRASLPSENRPDITKPLRTGAILGLFAGFALHWLAVRLDRRAFAVAEIEALGVPVEAEVPRLRKKHKGGVVIQELKDEEPFAEAIRSLQTTLSLDGVTRRGPQVIVIGSSTAGEGKSTITLNLAYTAARAGLKTLVIDADIRRGTIGKHLGFDDNTTGFSDFIRSKGQWRDFIRPANDHGFMVMTRGTDSASVVNSLLYGIPNALTAETKQEYDLVLIDSAPIVPVADTIPFLALADRIVFIVRLRGGSLASAARAMSVIRRSSNKPPLIVANGTRHSDSKYYYYGKVKA